MLTVPGGMFHSAQENCCQNTPRHFSLRDGTTCALTMASSGAGAGIIRAVSIKTDFFRCVISTDLKAGGTTAVSTLALPQSSCAPHRKQEETASKLSTYSNVRSL